MSVQMVIRVGTTHHGPLLPGLLIVLPGEEVTAQWENNVMFTNPHGGGTSFGEFVCFVTIPD